MTSPATSSVALRAATAGGPLLRLTSYCGGGCAGGVNLPFVEVALYDGGRAVLGPADERSWTMTEVRLDGRSFAAVEDLARTILVNSPDHLRLRGGVGVADGEEERLTAWGGARARVVGITQRRDGDLYRGSPDEARIEALARLLEIVQGAAVSGHAYVPTSLALYVEPTGVPVVPHRWPGPSLANFGAALGPSVPFGSPADLRCGIVTGASAQRLSLALGTDRAATWRDGAHDYEVTVRALLPEETTCEQAATP